jgi:hypothetical protein
MPAVASSSRDLRLDLFRALSLWLLFLEELLGSSGGAASMRSYGFSDPAAIFIFVFGYTAGAVYGRDLQERGVVRATMRIMRRAWVVYVAHVFLFVLYVCEISYVAQTFDNPVYIDATHLRALLEEPVLTLLQGLLLNFQIANMEALTLYLVLLAAFPPVLWLLVRSPVVALAGSAALYALAREHGWTLAAYPDGTWPLNPFAWQFLFVAGAWLGTGGGRTIERVLGSRLLQAFAVAYLMFALALVTAARVALLRSYAPAWMLDGLLPVNRAELGLAVLVHVMAIGIVAFRLVPRDWPALASPALRPVLLCGEYSLPSFCLGVFVAFAGWSVFVQISNGPAAHAMIACGGILLMITVAVAINWFAEAPGSPRRDSNRTTNVQAAERRAAPSRREPAREHDVAPARRRAVF